MKIIIDKIKRAGFKFQPDKNRGFYYYEEVFNDFLHRFKLFIDCETDERFNWFLFVNAVPKDSTDEISTLTTRRFRDSPVLFSGDCPFKKNYKFIMRGQKESIEDHIKLQKALNDIVKAREKKGIGQIPLFNLKREEFTNAV